jgi:hypothetical protein
MNTNENAIRKFCLNQSIKGLIGMLSIVAICAANTPAQAMSEGAKCAMKADLLKGELSLCLSKADANVSKGRSADTRKADQKCHLKFLAGWEKTRVKAQSKDAELGDNCAGRMTDAQSRASQASVLAAFERNLEEFGVRTRDLAANSTIRSLIEEVLNASFKSCDEPELLNGQSSADKDPSASTGLFRGCIPMDTDSDDPGLGNMPIHGDEDQPIHGDEDQPIINDEFDDVIEQLYSECKDITGYGPEEFLSMDELVLLILATIEVNADVTLPFSLGTVCSSLGKPAGGGGGLPGGPTAPGHGPSGPNAGPPTPGQQTPLPGGGSVPCHPSMEC